MADLQQVKVGASHDLRVATSLLINFTELDRFSDFLK